MNNSDEGEDRTAEGEENFADGEEQTKAAGKETLKHIRKGARKSEL